MRIEVYFSFSFAIVNHVVKLYFHLLVYSCYLIGNDSLDVNPLFQENEVSLENKADLVMDAMIVDKNATSRENAEGLSIVQKGT